MNRLLLFWGLGSFVFFKIVFDVSFYREDVSVLAALLLGVMVSISVYVSTHFYATKMGVHIARIRFKQPSNYLAQTIKIWLIAAISNIFLGKGIVFGFAKEFNRALGGDLLFRFTYSQYEERCMIFIGLVIIPVTVHFFTILYYQAQKMKGEETPLSNIEKQR